MDYKNTLNELREKMVSEITELMKEKNLDTISLTHGSNTCGWRAIAVPYWNTTGSVIKEFFAEKLELKDGVVNVILDRRPKRVPLKDLHVGLFDFYGIGHIYDYVFNNYKKDEK